MSQQSKDEAALFTAALPFNQHVGLEIDEARQGRAVGRLAVREQLHNHIGTLHAAAQFTLIEALSGAAAMSMLSDRLTEVTPLVEAVEVRYLKLLKGDASGVATLTASASDISQSLEVQGRARFDVAISLSDSQGLECTTALAHWYVRLNR